MIHSIIVSDLRGFVLLSKYFITLESNLISEWEQKIYNLTSAEWSQSKDRPHVAVDGDRFIVFSATDEVLLFVSGSGDDDDELGLSELLTAIIAVVQRLTRLGKGKPLTEALFIEHYSKICVALDIMVCNGVVNSLDADTIENYVRMSTDKKSKS